MTKSRPSRAFLPLDRVRLASAINYDHVHADDWFTEEHLSESGAIFEAVAGESAVGRCRWGIANYLLVDGHVEVTAADQISEWCREGLNFAIPPEYR